MRVFRTRGWMATPRRFRASDGVYQAVLRLGPYMLARRLKDLW